MERIEAIIEFADKSLGIVEKVSSKRITEHPDFKVFANFIPCAKDIVEIGSWWSAYRKKKTIPRKAIYTELY